MRAAVAFVALLLSGLQSVPAAQGSRGASPPPPRADAPAPPGQIAGRVVRPDGLPQPDAQVVLANRTQRGTLVQLPWRARTAFDGRYEIQRVPPGRYLVLVRPIGADVAVTGRPDATLFPGVTTTESGTVVDVLPGLSTEGIDIWLVPSPRRFSVSGRVYGPDGTSFDQLVIEMGRPDTRATDISTITDPGGLFTLDPVPPGTVVLRARATVGDRVLTGLAATTVAVQAVEDVRITVRDLIEVSGRVRTDTDAPLPPDLRIAFLPTLLGPTPLYPADESAVQPDGSFRVRAESGHAAVALRGLPASWQVVRVASGNPTSRRGIAVPPSGSLTGVDIVIGPVERNVPRATGLTNTGGPASVGTTETNGGR